MIWKSQFPPRRGLDHFVGGPAALYRKDREPNTPPAAKTPIDLGITQLLVAIADELTLATWPGDGVGDESDWANRAEYLLARAANRLGTLFPREAAEANRILDRLWR